MAASMKGRMLQRNNRYAHSLDKQHLIVEYVFY